MQALLFKCALCGTGLKETHTWDGLDYCSERCVKKVHAFQAHRSGILDPKTGTIHYICLQGGREDDRHQLPLRLNPG